MSRTNRIISKALGRVLPEAEFLDRRAQAEETISQKLAELDTIRAEADSHRQRLEANPVITPEKPVFSTAVIAKATAEMTDGERQHRRAERQKEALRIDEGLCREPMAVSFAEGLLSLGLMTSVETVVNAGFFLSAHLSAGPISALMTSALISVTNICASTTAGYFIGRGWNNGRDSSDPDAPEYRIIRRASRFCGGVYVAVIGLFHLTVGAIRAQETLDVRHGLQQYLDVVTTPESLFLTITGIVMSVLAFNKGRTAFDDPYLGYGVAGPAVQQCRDHLHDTLDHYVAEVESEFADEGEDYSAAKTELLSQITTHNAKVDDCIRLEQQLRAMIEQAETQAKADFAQIQDAYQAGSGKAYTAPSIEKLNALTSFASYLPASAPAHFKAPDFSRHEAKLQAAKAEAISQITLTFQRAINPETGETS